MCGIAGFIDASLPSKEFLTNSGYLMSKTLVHRGPDNKGIWVDENFGITLAHTRLSIVDLSINGSQPMLSQTGRFIIVFNGEIYNHTEIRNKIEVFYSYKKTWRSSSDTETLIEAIEAFGLKKTLNLCVGMFSFAVWDRQEKVIHLARDRFGEKPLYWGKIKTNIDNKSIFIFSSELSAIWEFPESVKSINTEAARVFLNYGYVTPPFSIQKGINQLLPGEYISIPFRKINFDEDMPPKPKKWWDTLEQFIKHNNSNFSGIKEKDLIIGLEKTLEKSINLQSYSDVSLGAFLSGGIDSSVVATLLQKNSINKIKTFNVSFPDIKRNESIIDEGPFAKEISKYIGSEHIEIELREKDSLEIIQNIGSHFSEPFADSSQVPTFLVCKEAKKAGLSVAMSGDGGDELFGGYNRHKLIPDIHKLFGIFPKNVLENFILPSLDNKIINSLISKEKSQKLFSSIKSSKDLEEIYYSLTSTGLESDSIFINSNLRKQKFNDIRLKQITDISERIMIKDLITYLPFDILVKMDRASMANSLETRTPFLDHRVVEYAWRIPIETKIYKNGIYKSGKYPLRKILYKYFPKTLFDRKKNGFTFPLNTWLKGPLKNWAKDIIYSNEIKNQGFIDQEKVYKIWNDHIENRRDNTSKLWTILMWQEWIKNWQK